jgi:hypothetical protein
VTSSCFVLSVLVMGNALAVPLSPIIKAAPEGLLLGWSEVDTW